MKNWVKATTINVHKHFPRVGLYALVVDTKTAAGRVQSELLLLLLSLSSEMTLRLLFWLPGKLIPFGDLVPTHSTAEEGAVGGLALASDSSLFGGL